MDEKYKDFTFRCQVHNPVISVLGNSVTALTTVSAKRLLFLRLQRRIPRMPNAYDEQEMENAFRSTGTSHRSSGPVLLRHDITLEAENAPPCLVCEKPNRYGAQIKGHAFVCQGCVQYLDRLLEQEKTSGDFGQ